MNMLSSIMSFYKPKVFIYLFYKRITKLSNKVFIRFMLMFMSSLTGVMQMLAKIHGLAAEVKPHTRCSSCFMLLFKLNCCKNSL